MSLALIHESAREVRRLAIAGSTLAVGDFRLKKLIPPLEQAGAKAPVFAQVAKAINDLVNGKEADSPANMLQLSTLLNAILYTQGQTGTTAAFGELETFAANSPSTKTSARVMKPLIEALSTSGSGHYEIVKSAVERGAFNDLRLIGPAIRALDHSFAELADLVAEKVLPGYGPGIVPLLKRDLDLKGKKSDARRLQVMHRLDPNGALEMCKKALEEGAPDIKVAAIACLGKHEDCLPLLYEQANSKNKAIRAAALDALAEHDRGEVTKLFMDALKGKSLDILAQPLRLVRNKQVIDALINEGKRVFELVLKGEDKEVMRYWEILNCLDGRKEGEIEDFLLTCLAQCEKLAKVKAAKNTYISGGDLVDRLVGLLYQIGSPQTLNAVVAKRESLSIVTFPQAVRCALRVWPPSKVFDEFSPLLGQKKGLGKEKADRIEHFIMASRWDDSSRFEFIDASDPDEPDDEHLKKVDWDPRWVDAAIKADRPVIVSCLAKPNQKGAIDYLLKQVQAKKQENSGLLIQGLARCQYPKITDTFLDLLVRKTKSAKYLDYDTQLLLDSARYLPVSDLPKLDAFAPNVDEKFVDKYLEALEPLRAVQKQEPK